MLANTPPSSGDVTEKHRYDEESVRNLIDKLNGSCLHMGEEYEVSLIHQGPSGSRVWAVGDDLILKRLPPKQSRTNSSAIDAQKLITSHPDLHIPVPKVLYAAVHDDGGADIVMKRLAGVPLATIWDRLSRWDKYSIAKEVGGFVAEWRRILPPADGVGFVRGQSPPELPPLLLSTGVPAVSGSGYTAIYDLFCTRRPDEDDVDDLELLMESMPDFGTCVFTHNNLCVDNILVRNKSVSGILGFNHAWYWPEWFEIVSLETYASPNQKVDQEWKEFLLLHMPHEQNPTLVTSWYSFWKQLRLPKEQREKPVVDILRKLLKSMQIEDIKYDYMYAQEHFPDEDIADEKYYSDGPCAEEHSSDKMSIDQEVPNKMDTEE
ncbi:hypothetical protein MFIFM68171_07061 [Madurella fahalii]|uniref:Aminoglycoside phosphotransferase domain-containing protein n=1 Tax=Madurella fahalii TaxID=1157608 RepID=A0ABQ0GGF4_9PEZI